MCPEWVRQALDWTEKEGHHPCHPRANALTRVTAHNPRLLEDHVNKCTKRKHKANGSEKNPLLSHRDVRVQQPSKEEGIGFFGGIGAQRKSLPLNQMHYTSYFSFPASGHQVWDLAFTLSISHFH